jgi:hypothetical protein
MWHVGVSALLKALLLVGGLGFKTHGPSNILINFNVVQLYTKYTTNLLN